MSGTVKDELAGLVELGTLLQTAGFRVRTARASGRPCLAVTNPAAARMSESVFAGRDAAGRVCFWWSWGEVICPADEPAVAAARITRVLS